MPDRSTVKFFKISFISLWLFSCWILRHDLENRFLCCWRWNAVTWLSVKLWRVETLTLVSVLHLPPPVMFLKWSYEKTEFASLLRRTTWELLQHMDKWILKCGTVWLFHFFNVFCCLLIIFYIAQCPFVVSIFWLIVCCVVQLSGWMRCRWSQTTSCCKTASDGVSISTYASLNEYWSPSLVMTVDSLHGCDPSEEWDEPRRFLHDTEEPACCTQSIQTGEHHC